MLPSNTTFNKNRKQQGFAIFTSAVLLSIAGIMFTASLASSQLVDNQIIGNYYRNNEAFANAESGINFVLSMLDNKIQAGVLLEGLPSNSDEPITITSTASHYQVNIYKNHSRKITIISSGTSMDGTASRNIQLEADFYLDYPIPVAAVSSNGKFNLDETAVVNDGCEGLGMEECLGGRNIADHMLVSNPDFEDDESDLCSGGSVGENVIADGVLLGATTEKIIEETSDGGYDWGGATIPDGSEIAGIPSDPDMVANSLFESTFGIEMSQGNLDDIWDNAATINMTNGGDCSDLLQDVSEEDEIIYIKGDCNISQYYTVQSKTSQNKVFTIGSVEHPKLVFIEGGTFVTAPNTGANIVGMLYFLPSKHDQINDDGDHVLDDDGNRIQVLDTSVDMGGVNVNGALLSEYKCSYNGYDKADNKGTKQHFTTRFDKLVLGNLYSEMGMGATNSGYRLSSGTWRDF